MRASAYKHKLGWNTHKYTHTQAEDGLGMKSYKNRRKKYLVVNKGKMTQGI